MKSRTITSGRYLLAAVFLMIFGSGCFETFNSTMLNKFSLHSDNGTYDVERVRLCNAYLDEQKYTEALAVIRQEILAPEISGAAQLAYIRINGIYALAEYVRFHPATPDLDEEALRYYREGLSYAHAEESRRVSLHHMMALYYSLSDRNGAMLPYIRKELAYYRRTDDTYQLIICYDALADGYADVGQKALAKYYRRQALDLAGRYFVLDRHPDFEEKSYQWINYTNLLRDAMDDLAEPGNADKILDLWKIEEPIIKAYIMPEYLGYLETAEYLAMSGAVDEALRLYQRAEAIGREEFELEESARFAPMDLVCTRCSIMLHTRDYKTAAAAADQCLAMKSSFEMEPSPRGLGIYGLAYEGAGNHSRAIECFQQSIAKYEQMRSSYSISERAAFFRSIQRQSYWGLTRCLARKAMTTKSDDDFLNALRVSELLRARQFGELQDSRMAVEIGPESLRRIIDQLPADMALLDYVFTDSHIVLFAMARSDRFIRLIPYDRNSFNKQIRALLNDLSTSNSRTVDIEQALMKIDHVVLDDVREWIRDKKRIVVLSDGLLNALPFDLLSLEKDRYQPLLIEHTVSITPSLKYLVRARSRSSRSSRSGLFGLADPAYANSSSPISGLSKAELRAVSRGDDYLAYFQALPETRMEVEKIAAMFSGETVTKMYGATATESALKHIDLRSYGYLHLATHGILGNDVPGITEPALVLASESDENGFLTASEAGQLALNAELTVLSACNTGSGEYFTGEGVMGMSRSFLLAGSRNVLVSLWSIPSLETVRLMQRFYAVLKTGAAPAEALRAAKLDFIQSNSIDGDKNQKQRGIDVRPNIKALPAHRHPFYWAAFFIVGE